MKKCSICGDFIKGHGHDARPVNEGTCCDVCNYAVVIPSRLKERKISNGKSDKTQK